MGVPVATTTGFGEIKHVDGVSPAWPVGYDEFEPWYTKAQWLYQVHGNHGEDPTGGHWSRQYPWPAVSHEPRIQEISDALAAAGYITWSTRASSRASAPSTRPSPPWRTRSASASTSTSASHD